MVVCCQWLRFCITFAQNEVIVIVIVIVIVVVVMIVVH